MIFKKDSIEIDAHCIHLLERKDREENMYMELNKFCSNYRISPGIKHSIGAVGISLSIRKIIMNSKIREEKCVLILEDDVKFTSDRSNMRFQECIDSLPDDWDILLGGVYSAFDLTKIDNCDKLYKLGDFAALHCVLYRDTVYDKVLSHRPEADTQNKNMDRYLGKLSKDNIIKIYLCYPMVAIQYDGVSSISNSKVDYTKMLDKFELFT